MYSIGEFSKITGLSVKTLRFYHEQGLLVPSSIDDQTGYRYYGDHLADRARIITSLRGLEFSLTDIAEMFAKHDDESDIIDYLDRQKAAIQTKLRHYRDIDRALDEIINRQREVRRAMQSVTYEIEEKRLSPVLIAGIRMKGKYSDCGPAFGRLGRQFGFRICGKPMLLIYDHEYREEDADFEACMPVRSGKSADGIDVRELPGGRAVTLLHQGPYDQLGRSYAKILDDVKQKRYEIQTPCREVYIKGPGMIFKGNPMKYLTEIQMLIDE
jgi:DNA-binding transcriptional MerR regulator/effector-binding domain-containing protein